MNAVVSRVVDAYTRLEVETGVASASPQRLIILLYDGAIRAALSAKAAMSRGEVSRKG